MGAMKGAYKLAEKSVDAARNVYPQVKKYASDLSDSVAMTLGFSTKPATVASGVGGGINGTSSAVGTGSVFAKKAASDSYTATTGAVSAEKIVSKAKTRSSVISEGIHNFSDLTSNIAIKKKMSALQSAQKKAVRTEILNDGRVRYYMQERPSNDKGPTRGASYVVEHNPKTGKIRSWNECYDHQGNVNRVHPKMIDSQDLDALHYPLTKSELTRRSKP